MKSGIYIIINLITDKIYVGSAIDFDERWRIHLLHLNRGTHHSILLQRAWDKYGADNFLFIAVEEVENKNQLEVIEQIWLDATECCNPEIGYNLAPIAGSMRNYKHTDKARKNMSDAHIGNKASKETKALMSKQRIGNTINKNRKWSKEAVEARAKSNTGKKRSPEFGIRNALLHRGSKRSPETRLRQSLAAKRRWIRADKDRMWAW